MDILQWDAKRKERRSRRVFYTFFIGYLCINPFTLLGVVKLQNWWKHRPPKTTQVNTWYGATAVGTLGTSFTFEPPKANPLNNADLEAMFAQLNRKYFSGELPKMPVYFEESKEWEGLYSGAGPEIRLAPHEISQGDTESLAYLTRSYRQTLLHEMAHAWVFRFFPSEHHGTHWKAEMRHLAQEGAFDDLLWSEESGKDP